MATSADPYNAFVPQGRFQVPGQAGGHLDGLTFAVKDVFDVAGHVTSAGNPSWSREARPADAHAAVVARLLDAGASICGKTICDEFAYGIMGVNPHQGDPRNPAAPGHFTGGSSCGSAAAVAAGSCDFALGTDTGGSIRVPASYCGLFSFRPSHGRLPLDGVLPLAPSFDTVAWLARDAVTLERVGYSLLGGGPSENSASGPLLVATDAFDLVEPGSRQAFDRALGRLTEGGPTRGGLTRGGLTRGGLTEDIRLAGPAGELSELLAAFQAVQGFEAWSSHGDWVERHPGALGPAAAERFRVASAVSAADAATGRALLGEFTEWLTSTLASGASICLPAAVGPAPRIDVPVAELGPWRQQMMRLTCAAPAAGVPQVTLPIADMDGLPLGVSFMSARGSDRSLLAAATAVAAQIS